MLLATAQVRPVSSSALATPERDDEKGHGEAVVEAAFDVERLPYPGRYGGVGDHFLAQGRVG